MKLYKDQHKPQGITGGGGRERERERERERMRERMLEMDTERRLDMEGGLQMVFRMGGERMREREKEQREFE